MKIFEFIRSADKITIRSTQTTNTNWCADSDWTAYLVLFQIKKEEKKKKATQQKEKIVVECAGLTHTIFNFSKQVRLDADESDTMTLATMIISLARRCFAHNKLRSKYNFSFNVL